MQISPEELEAIRLRAYMDGYAAGKLDHDMLATFAMVVWAAPEHRIVVSLETQRMARQLQVTVLTAPDGTITYDAKRPRRTE